jgi:hypothetical protein
MTKIEMVIDSIRVSLIDYQRVVMLKEKAGERYLPMWIDAAQGDAIATGLQKAHSPEMLTHDFICSIISSLGAVVKYVVVTEFAEETFSAKALLEREGRVIEIDCRPSDAFATALRAEAPIFVTEEVLEKAGLTTGEINKIDRSEKGDSSQNTGSG